jgi:RNA polymerase sigma-70 factor (ECF subfamily)
VIDRARRRKPDMSLDVEMDEGKSMVQNLAGADPGPDERLSATELGRRIVGAVNALPAEQKEVFVLRAQSDLPFKEIARIQNVSINTALARMQYALAKLRPLLRDDYEQLGRAQA